MAKKPGPKKGFTYPDDRQVDCPLCLEGGTTRTFRSKPGLSGHLQFYHSLDRESVSQVMANLDGFGESKSVADLELTTSVASPSQSNKQLADEVQRLRLLREKRNLEGVAPEPHAPDASEAAGLGPMTEPTKDKLQERAFGLGGGQLTPLQQMAQEAEALDKLRGINPQKQGGADGFLGGILGLAAALGFTKEDIRNAVGRIMNPQRVSTNGVDLEGFKLPADVSDETFQKVLDYKGKIEAAKLEKEGRDGMAKAWDSLFKAVGPLVLEKVQGIGGIPGGGGAPIGGKPGQPKGGITEIPCPKCGEVNRVTYIDTGGDKLPFKCKACGYEEVLDAVEEHPGSRKHPKGGRLKGFSPQEPELDTIQCSCGQIIQVPPDKQIGDVLICPVCNNEVVLMSETEAVLAMEPTSKGPEFEERRRR